MGGETHRGVRNITQGGGQRSAQRGQKNIRGYGEMRNEGWDGENKNEVEGGVEKYTKKKISHKRHILAFCDAR